MGSRRHTLQKHPLVTHLNPLPLTTCVATTTATPVAMAVETAMAVDLAPIMAVDMTAAMEPDMAVDMALALVTAATGQFAIGDVILLAARISPSKPCLLLTKYIKR